MIKLLIVESPTKARTIKKFLGAGYNVVSSFGHIRDLPKREMGIDFENDFEPKYIVPTDKKDKVKELKDAAKRADEIYLATDEDREGEAIAWHIANVLDIDPAKAKRITFHEITKSAIEHALEKPRHIEQDLVDAQQARRILDRIVGYELSPFLWKKVQRGLSAGRVQSVAVRLIVERERERRAFKQEEYWSVEGLFKQAESEIFDGKLVSVDGKKLDKLAIKTGEEANAIIARVDGKPFIVDSVEKKHANKQPPTPIRTSILQQEANNKLGMSAKQTMTLAQKLYETGKITYMRTDSMNLSEAFLSSSQEYLQKTFGEKYAGGKKVYKTSDKSAQEAHEAIRPTDINATPESLKTVLESGQWRLYDLIWRRTLASQMPPASIERTTIDFTADNVTFRANGSMIVFDGYMKVYRGSKETILPNLSKGDSLNAEKIEAKQHFTEPPARYSDATLIKVLEEHGIGRPSTYAPTIATIESRGYVTRDDNKKLAPSDIAEIVNDLLVEHFASIVDLEFTAHMEQKLDDVADGKLEPTPMLHEFYDPFHKNIADKTKEVSRDDIMPAKELGVDPKTGKQVLFLTGRFGPYVQLGEYTPEDKKEKKPKPPRASLPKDMKLDDLTFEKALALLAFPKKIGEKNGEDIVIMNGPYGPYVKNGKTNVSLPEGTNLLAITDEEALAVFEGGAALKSASATPLAELGTDPESGGTIQVKTGRYGPYVTDGKTNVSIPKSEDPATLTSERAIELLAKKRANPSTGWKKGKGGFKGKKKPSETSEE